MAEYVLETDNIGISFGGLKAAQHVNIKIEKGEIYGLIGPNGAGKTTIFNMLTGVYLPPLRRISQGAQPGGDKPQGHRPHIPEYPAFQ